jgi:hypothetical protein
VVRKLRVTVTVNLFETKLTMQWTLTCGPQTAGDRHCESVQNGIVVSLQVSQQVEANS